MMRSVLLYSGLHSLQQVLVFVSFRVHSNLFFSCEPYCQISHKKEHKLWKRMISNLTSVTQF